MQIKIKNKSIRFISFLLIFCLTMSPIIPAYGANSDISGHWAEETLKKWNEKNWFKGDGAGTFRPDDGITRAEFISLVNKMNGYTSESDKILIYKDISADKWYYSDISKALAAGYISGTSPYTMSPESKITRQEAVVIIDKIKNISPSEDLSILLLAKDGEKADGWAKPYLAAAVKEGLIGGINGNINPAGNITRAETVVLLDRIYTDTRIYNFAAQYGPKSGTATIGNAIISSPDVVLKNIVVNNTLEIAKEVGEGNVTLENVVVNGDVHVYGGGVNSIIFNNVDVKGALIVNKNNGDVRILATGSTSISVTVLKSGAIIVTKELTGGGFESVEIPADIIKGQKIVFDGNFKSITNNASNINLEVNGKIKDFTANANANITGNAAIEKISANKDISVTVNGKNVSSQASPSGGSSGGGGSTVYVYGVSISDEDFSLKVGEKKTLTAVITPSDATNKNVAWSSSNTEVAAVSAQGEVTAKAVGAAVITVTSVSGSKTDTVNVTVKPAQSQITPSLAKVNESKITTSSALTAKQVANSKNINITQKMTENNSYEVKINAADALIEEDGQKKAYIIISLKENNLPADTSGITASLASTGSAVAYDIKFGDGLSEDIKNGSFLFEINAGNPETVQNYTLKLFKANYSDLTLNIVYVPSSVAEITGIGNITGETAIGSVLTAGEVTYSKAEPEEYNPSYQWYRSEFADKGFTAIEGATEKTYTLTESDSGKYIRVKAATDGTKAYGSAQSSTFGPVEKLITPNDVFEALKNAILGENTSLTSITHDLKLVTTLPDFPGVEIMWNSDNTDIINAIGKIVRDKEEDKIVNLTATLSGKVTGSKVFEGIVRMESLDNVGIVGYIDEKFAEGYPQAYVKGGTVWVKFMLKEDAEMYMVINGMNGHTESDAQAVFEGHAGKGGELIWVNSWPYFDAKANQPIEFDTNEVIGSGHRKEFRIEFAVKTSSGYESEKSTTILFSSEVVAALDTAPPNINGTFISKALNEIYVYFEEQLDLTSKPVLSDFTLHGDGEGSIGTVKSVNLVNIDDEYAWPASYVKLAVEGITQNEVEDLMLSYTGTAIRDTSDAKNPADNFDEEVIASVPKISNITLSHDRKNMIVEMVPGYNVNEYKSLLSKEKIIVTAGGSKYYNVDDDIMFSYSPDHISFELEFANALPNGNITVEIVTEGMKTYAYEDISGNLKSNAVEVIGAPGTPKAEYNSEEKEITIKFADGFKIGEAYFAHVFTLNIAGKEYKLRGQLLSRNWNENNSLTIQFGDLYEERFVKAIETGYTESKSVQIKYDRLHDNNEGRRNQVTDAAGALIPAFGYIKVNKN